MDNQERLRAGAMEHYGVGPYELDELLEEGQMPSTTAPQMGRIAANQTAELDLDAEFEAHCVDFGD
jgi:hypothetical protein